MKDRIRELRKSLGLTLEGFGAKVGMKKNSLSQIENGKNNITEQTILSICNANWNGKKVNETWLRTGEGEMFKKEFLEDEYMAYVTEIGNGASDVLKQAIIKYGRLSPENRKIIDDAIDLLIKMMKEG